MAKTLKIKAPKPVKMTQFKQRQAKSGKMVLYEKNPGSGWKKSR
jgi:hypothetical protein